jgi:Zn-dependent protease with chaperone function
MGFRNPEGPRPSALGGEPIERVFTGSSVRFSSTVVFRMAAILLAAWALLATTGLIWVLLRGGFGAIAVLVTSPGALLGPNALEPWVLGALGAFLVFLVAFVLCQAVGRGLLRMYDPRPLPWPRRLPFPNPPTRLLAFASPRPDAFTFTLLRRSGPWAWRREETVLVSEGLLRELLPDEWEAVVAHELGHVRDLDGRYLTFFRTLARMMRWDPVLALMAGWLTRREEFGADAHSVALTGRPRALARAIYKASRLLPSHPGPLASLLGPGGRRGQYQAIERIRRLVALAESGRFAEECGG